MKYKIGEKIYETKQEMLDDIDYTARPTGLNLIKEIEDPAPLKEYPEDATEEEIEKIKAENNEIKKSNIDYRFDRYETKEEARKGVNNET